MKKPIISIVVPCYNEDEALHFFNDAFCKLANTMQSSVDFEVLYINDGSEDNTLEVLRKIAQNDNRAKYISFSRNFGKEAAMLAGLRHATGDYIAIADADLQDPIALLVEMYALLQEGNYDCVATRRSTRSGEPFLRSLFANCFYKFINVFSETEIVSGARDFRLMTRGMVQSILKLKEYNRFSKGIFSFVGYRTKWLEYKNIERIAGHTSWSFWSLFKYSHEGILAFTTAPLHLASILGIAVCCSSFLFIIYTLLRTFIWGDPVAGYPTLICIIAFLGGVQLFCIGILSEYISKIYSEVKRRPAYIIKDSNIDDEKHMQAVEK